MRERTVRGEGRAPGILIFDSGLGGLTVAAEIRKALPAACLAYVADDAAFPYGAWPEAALTGHVAELVEALVAEHRPDLVVIACNTASTLVLPPLRARLSIPVVGTVPAIKPAAALTRSGLVAVLGTPGTVRRDYTFSLIAEHAADVAVKLVGSARLAGIAEARLRGEAVDRAAVAEEIAPCFVARDDRRTDVVVLACTHFPLLRDLFETLAPWRVTWIDPAPAIARRVVAVLGEGAAGRGGSGVAADRFRFTSAQAVPQTLIEALARYGLRLAQPRSHAPAPA